MKVVVCGMIYNLSAQRFFPQAANGFLEFDGVPAKGKVHTRYEFGVKAGFVTASRTQLHGRHRHSGGQPVSQEKAPRLSSGIRRRLAAVC